MEKINLNAKKRTISGKKVKNLRAQGFVPAVIYGKDKKGLMLEIDAKEFSKIYDKAGSSALVDLTVDKDPVQKVLIQDVQYDPVKDAPIHVDLYAIKMDEKITTEIPIKFIGVSPAVKDMEGSFIANYDEIEVECLPGDLISEITVDISRLKTFEDNIKVADLDIPKNIKVLAGLEEVVALVNAPRSEEELEAMETEAAADKEKATIDSLEAQAEAEKKAKEEEKAEEGKTDAKKEEAPKTAEKKEEAKK